MGAVHTHCPHWLVRWLPRQNFTLNIDDDSVHIEGIKRPWAIPWSKIKSPPRVERGLIFATILLDAEGTPRSVRWLSKRNSDAIESQCNAGWFGSHGEKLRSDAERISALASSSRFLRDGNRRKVEEEATESLVGWDQEIGFDTPPERYREPLRQLRAWAHQSEDVASRHNARFVERQLEEHRELFDTIESNPLTPKQREACVIDEENNLILAGAGSGKTSVMIGRAAYLLRSGLAKPNQILMLAFGSKAADEMRERIEAKVNVTGVVARTFHSFGQEIITSVEGGKPNLSPLAEDGKLLKKNVDMWFEDLLQKPWYRKTVIRYFNHHLYCEKNPFDFSTLGEYYAYLEANEVRTLKGEKVKGFGECHIANWLFQMGVDYVYEERYQQVETRTPEFRTYRPDFYLPDHNIYIEHFGVDRRGNTAPYVDRTKYVDGMVWKRELHETNETVLVETFHYEHAEGILLERLSERLAERGVQFAPLPDEAILETLREFGAVGDFSELLTQLLSRYKANHFDEEKLERRIVGSFNPKQTRGALEVLKPVVDCYEKSLADTKSIDFDDMVGRAIEYVESGRYIPHYRFILVDEFQDISEPRAHLLRATKQAAIDCSLFCVGDDWQSIYRFTGADISLTTNFAQHFGPTRITSLDRTFRFNESIGDVATRFVTQNPAQLSKVLSAHPREGLPAVRLLRRYDDWQGLVEACTNIAKEVGDCPTTIDVLARFWFMLPDKANLRRLNRKFPTLRIESRSIHGSKGLESDFVVVVGLSKGKNGFPSEKVTHPLLEAFLPPKEPMVFAEERRLFYVALTRAKKEAWLIADMRNSSCFITELLRDQYPIAMEENDTPPDQIDAVETYCMRCETGTLISREGKNGRFYACNNFPRCEHTEDGCSTCGRIMHREVGFKRCGTCEDSVVPLCPHCGAELRLRNGKFGVFWGCANYRKGSDVTCSFTISPDKIDLSGK